MQKGGHRANGSAPAQEVQAPMQAKRTGIRERHSRSCPVPTGKCNCTPSYEAWVFDRRAPVTDKNGKQLHDDAGKPIFGAKIRKSFAGKGALSAAKAWRADATSALNKGTLRTPSRQTLREAGTVWLEGAKAKTILTRSGRPYKPSALRGYEADLERHVYPELGALRLAEIRRADVQALVDRLVGKGLSGSKVRNAVMPVRAIVRHALERDELHVNPTTNLRLPAVGGRRDRVATPAEAATLLAAVPEDDRALWATAFYGGLRLGELRALAAEHVDLKAGEIHVQRSWDVKEGFIDPKSEKGTRKVPIPAALKLYLAEHIARTGRRGPDLIFGRTASAPFTQTWVRKRALRAWAERYACGCEIPEKGPKTCSRHGDGPLAPIGLHEARHTYVSMMFEAGVPLETIGDFVGHAGSYMTERYRHLLPDSGANAAAKLDEYLSKARGL